MFKVSVTYRLRPLYRLPTRGPADFLRHLFCFSLMILLFGSCGLSRARMQEQGTNQKQVDRSPQLLSTSNSSLDLSVKEVYREWIKSLPLKGTKSYEGGIYGKHGSKVVFVADKRVVPDYERLYWVMVKVLSEKYGCFIRGKVNVEDQVVIRCRDKRTIVFNRASGDRWIHFSAKQYDLQGREIYIANADTHSSSRW